MPPTPERAAAHLRSDQSDIPMTLATVIASVKDKGHVRLTPPYLL